MQPIPGFKRERLGRSSLEKVQRLSSLIIQAECGRFVLAIKATVFAGARGNGNPYFIANPVMPILLTSSPRPYMKSKIVVLLLGIVALFITLNRGIWQEQRVISWDGTGYYMYLPAAIIHHDLGHLSFYAHIDSVYHPSGDVLQYTIQSHEATGRRSTHYPMGVALLELPGFLVADYFTRHYGQYPRDGYSAPYQLAVALGTIGWVIIGLFLLRRFLLRFYPESVVWKVLLLAFAGTNLYYYTAFFPSWSHPYSFFLFAVVLYVTESWYREGKLKWVLLLGLTMGLVVITRPSNIVIALIPLLWPQERHNGRVAFLKSQLWGLFAAFLLFVGVLFLQMTYWKYVTGQWVYYSYKEEGFDFLHPRLVKGLFSYRKGWAVYTPLAFLFCVGLWPLYRRSKALFAPFAAFLAVNIYVIFSWKAWHYGGCFSCRPMVESVAVLALPACALVQRISLARKAIVRAAATVIIGFLVVLNLFQTYQYSLGVIHYDRMTRKYYWRVFGKLKVTEADRQLLRPASEDEPDN